MQNVMQALYLTRNACGLPASARRYNKRGENPQEREKRPGTDTGPFTPDGEYDSLDAWADEDER